MRNYIKLARRAYEVAYPLNATLHETVQNDDRQIRLTAVGTQPGTWELRRLHRVNGEEDDAEADKADEVLMRNLGNFSECSSLSTAIFAFRSRRGRAGSARVGAIPC